MRYFIQSVFYQVYWQKIFVTPNFIRICTLYLLSFSNFYKNQTILKFDKLMNQNCPIKLSDLAKVLKTIKN